MAVIFSQTLLGLAWKMKIPNCGLIVSDPTSRRFCFCSLFPVAALLCIAYLIGTTFVTTDYKKIFWFGTVQSTAATKTTRNKACEVHCGPSGSEPLPKGIINKRSNLEMQALWDSPKRKKKGNAAKSLLAIAAGIKQKETVGQIVEKFLTSDFTVMLFHYDGVVDKWMDLSWSDQAIHVSAMNQTKWWFAKRFLHPDIVSEYAYIFLWDEDLEVSNFHPDRYLKIVLEEGLEISQPALDAAKSEVHHRITARGRRTRVHRRMYKFTGGGRCYANSTGPPCTGWVEMMAPVFSKAAWRCTWHMIQNDLIHAWGLDMKLGYCAQGDRTKTVGVVDAEYIVHKGIPTLGGLRDKEPAAEPPTHSPQSKNSKGKPLAKPVSSAYSGRSNVRIRSSAEFDIFKRRWHKASMEDKCWTDPYPEATQKSNTTA